MSLLTFTSFVFAAGMVDGIVNAMLSENGFLMPKWEAIETNSILRLGFSVTCSTAGLLLAYLGDYMPFLQVNLFGAAQPLAMG